VTVGRHRTPCPTIIGDIGINRFQSRIRHHAIDICPVVVFISTTATQPWPATLSLAGDGYWRQRIRLTLHNDGDGSMMGEPWN